MLSFTFILDLDALLDRLQPTDLSTMRTSVFVLATVAAGLAGAEIKKEDYFPECSIDCLNDGTEQATDCSTTDAVCWCVQSNYEAIYNQAVNCVLTECGADEAIGMFSLVPLREEDFAEPPRSTSRLGPPRCY